MASSNQTTIETSEGPATVTYVAQDGVTEQFAERAIEHGDVASAIEGWMRRNGSFQSRGQRDVFRRDRYTGPMNIFQQMGRAAEAVETDDILSTLADTTESMALQRLRFEMNDEDEEDVWNQIAADIDLDTRFRQVWRETFKVSQAVVGVWWQRKAYTVRTPALQEGDIDPETGKRKERGRGNRSRRRQFDLVVPTQLTILDPTKVIPVGNLMFGGERLAYIADETEERSFGRTFAGEQSDITVMRMLEGKYTPSREERDLYHDLGVDTSRLWLMREEAAFRFTLTKADYERFPSIRLKAIFELLEMKGHLKAADRANLIGNTNFIVVITIGSDKLPAHQAEVDSMKEQATIVARLPILVGDHRLNVEIVAPKMDWTLDEKRYGIIDHRLAFNALNSFEPTQSSWASHSSGSEESEIARVVALNMESRRHMIRRSFEKHLFLPALERNEELTEKPHLAFSPKRITLSVNPQVLNMLFKVRDRGDLSRETMLEEMDIDQSVEVLRRMREKETADLVMQTAVPFSSPDSNPFRDGQQGGRPTGVTEEQPRKRGGKPEGDGE